jgi:hypothetical protein
VPDYELLVVHRDGAQHKRPYATENPLEPGAVIIVEGRHWLVAEIDEGEGPPLAVAKPARYRLTLHHPGGRDEPGAFRRFRPDGPRLGHAFTTIEDGAPASWAVTGEQLALDEQGEPFLALIAERDFAEADGDIPDHELEHALAKRDWDELPEGAAAAFSRAERQGLSVELVALDEGEEPDWEEAERFLDSLIVEEIEDDVFEMCGVDTGHDPRETWLEKVKERLREDLQRLRTDIEGDHDELEEWDFRGTRIFAAVGNTEGEADPDSGYGWLVRLVDAEVLGAAGFSRVRRAELA